MRDLTRSFIRALECGGVPLLIEAVIKVEQNHESTAGSELATPPGRNMYTIRESLLEILGWTMRAIITGNFIRDGLRPKPGETLPADFEPSQPSQHSHGSGSSVQWEVERIEDAAICEIEDSDDYGRVVYHIKWTGFAHHANTWESIDNLTSCRLKILQFYHDNPDKPQYGPNDCQETLSVEHLDFSGISGFFTNDPPAEHQIIYAHWLVDNTNTSSRGVSPTTKQLFRILELLEFYMSDFPIDHPGYTEHLEFIRTIGQLEDPDHLFRANWDEELNDNGLRRYLKSQDNFEPNRRAQRICLETTIPTIRSQLELIPIEERDRPYPYPLSEIGFTGNAKKRKRSYEDHSSSMKTMYCIGAISIYLFGVRYHWNFHPLPIVRSYSEAKCLELFSSQLSQSYTWLGGMNTDLAGNSNDSAAKISTETYHILRDKTLNNYIIFTNLELARERLEESVEIMGLKLEVDELTERLTNEEAEIADLRAKQRSLRDELAVLLREKKKLVKRAAAERNIIKEGLMAYDRMKELHTCLKKLLNY
ncbi:1f85286a-83f9-419d-a012-f93f6817d44c [Sclerotinia trifoliorum]|uniref:1f85286a-83f9-419d-a012-f93f6817d44c n=1 Tax=Sclerotinia trifoliorum TaxID=28548 RepID=A0A8H2VYQ6_9HELO|nr:1f85286a-83f9-419d-a012-f93f6817d44c [Sclerotinia trifoliorum]